MTSLDHLRAANQPLWDEEAAVCRRYFRSASRTDATDLRWIARQAAKELHDGVVPRLRELEAETDANRLVAIAEELHEEAVHYAAFVRAHDALRGPGDPPLDDASLRRWVSWPANDELRELRRRHREDHGRLGAVAALVTEGGRAVLFAEGMALAGGGGADDVIAEACAAVHADEVRHMASGLDDVAGLALTPEEWATVTALTVAQSEVRIRMREEQFGA